MPFWLAWGYPLGLLGFTILGGLAFYLRSKYLDRAHEREQLELPFASHHRTPGE